MGEYISWVERKHVILETRIQALAHAEFQGYIWNVIFIKHVHHLSLQIIYVHPPTRRGN